MGFRDFITNRWFRRRLADEFERYENIKPPERPSRQYIDRLVGKLLDPQQSRDAHKELSMIGPEAVEALAAALGDARIGRPSGPSPLTRRHRWTRCWSCWCRTAAHLVAAANSLVESPSPKGAGSPRCICAAWARRIRFQSWPGC